MDWLDRIKTAKSNMQLTNEELSERSGIPFGTLNKLLCGATASPKLSVLVALSRALGCSVDYIVSGEEGTGFTPEEQTLLHHYRETDETGRRSIRTLAEAEYRRAEEERRQRETYDFESDEVTKEIDFYDMPASAGTGAFLDSDHAGKIRLKLNDTTARADYALRVSGDSMEPKFSDGDIVIVEAGDRIPEGKIGIFVLNGEGYIKKFGTDRLISLNSRYSDIMLRPGDELSCRGLVLGRLKKARA